MFFECVTIDTASRIEVCNGVISDADEKRLTIIVNKNM